MNQSKPSERSRFLALGLLTGLLAFAACSAPPQPITLRSAVDAASASNSNGDTNSNDANTGNGDATASSQQTSSSNGGSTTASSDTMQTADMSTASMSTTTTTEAQKFVPCTEQSEKCHPHRMILSDYALGKIIHVNLDDPSKDWDLEVPGGARDIQLIGDNKMLVSTVEWSNGPYGWHEVDLDTGKIVKSVVGLTSTVMSVQRLANGNTLLIGQNLLGGSGADIIETNDKKEIISRREFKGMENFRTVRRSRDGHFFVGNHRVMMEFTPDGKEVWRADGGAEPAYMALKLPNGERIMANGHGGKIFFFAPDGVTKTLTISLPDIDSTHSMTAFASGFALLPNGNIVTTNWAGSTKTHGNDGPQVAEYNRKGEVVWTWKQQANRISAIYAVLVLDNLDLSKPHDDTAGPLAPVQTPYP